MGKILQLCFAASNMVAFKINSLRYEQGMIKPTPTAKRKATPAMKFLWWIGSLTLLAVGLAVTYRLFETQIWRMAMVPRVAFAKSPVDPAPEYSKPTPAAWVAWPGLKPNPSEDAPRGFQAAPKPPVDVFFITPTTYYDRQRWNAPLADAQANRLLDQVARTMASSFNNVGSLYIPRYRQATFGAFLAKNSSESAKALDLAYADVLAAFDAFQVARGALNGPQRPFILAAHSQGSLHALRLLRDRFSAPLIRKNLVAAYIVGWPVSIEADLTPLSLKPCETPQAIGCVMAWQSFGAQGANTELIDSYFQSSTSYNDVPRQGTHILCTNPLTGWINGKDASPEANLGALAFSVQGKPIADLIPRLTGANCTDKGFLQLSTNPGAPFADRKMSGENYHSYDYGLFWANIRANAEARVSAFYTPR
jgi:Protein of unknown function (DUF3089)